MRTIKRYPNRKLYDTEAKRYITLEGIAELIRQGEDVQVVDHATGEDLTALILTQIISEQERKRSGFLPQAVLTGLIRAGGETLSALRRALATPLGLLLLIDEEIERRVQSLISRGELAREDGLRLLDKLLVQAHRTTMLWPGEQELEQMLIERGVLTRHDLRQLMERLDELAARLDDIKQQRGGDAPP